MAPSGVDRRFFTDLDGRFSGRLVAVIPVRYGPGEATQTTGTSAQFRCFVKVEYDPGLMGMLQEGMLLAVKNFKPQTSEGGERYTLMETSRVWPVHFGLSGLSDQSYYPMQFEIIQQSERDWGKDDQATMMIQIDAIPINHEMVIKATGEQPEFKKGFVYPVLASEVRILNDRMIHLMYNSRIVDKYSIRMAELDETARGNPRLGIIKMFEEEETRIPLFMDFENLVRYHFGVFAFTGGGKSNLLASIIRKILHHAHDTKIVLFDISCEYPFLLLDVLTDPSIPSKVILETRVDNAEQLLNSTVKPRIYETDERTLKGYDLLVTQGRVGYYTKPRYVVPTYADFLGQLAAQRSQSTERPHYLDAIEVIETEILGFMESHGHGEDMKVGEEFVKHIDEVAIEAVNRMKVSDRSGLYSWATTRSSVLEIIRKNREEAELSQGGYSVEKLLRVLEGEERILCISIADPFIIKDLVIHLTQAVLGRRKRRFQVKPYVLFVFDEAQEFIPDYSSTGIDNRCTRQVETLLRQGRKYGLGGCVATQRIAYLNTNALQQLHTYFIGTLPRPYDRELISNTFMIDQGILERTLQFAPGEWLVSSFIATGMENVPIFIRADNAELELDAFLSSI